MARTKRDGTAPYWISIWQAERQILEYALEMDGSIDTAIAGLRISREFFKRRCRALGVKLTRKRPKVIP